MDFTLLTRAGMTQREFADISGVSRATVNMWSTAKMKPHRYIEDRIASVLAAVKSAIENDALPLPRSVPKHQRLAALQAALANEPTTAG
jgi:transcriptional regulator with XRE-family HTH domain